MIKLDPLGLSAFRYRPLGLSLEGALEDLPEVDLPTLASLCNRHYQAMRHRVRALRRIIGMETNLPPSQQGGFK